ncbi:MAG: FIST C-terminal domain-containing protein [Motiliproteus sp.]|nr:FIST C-terminal domain-containing protein [Motiliproteus sp.]
MASQSSDPFRAGLELGEGLHELHPEVVFVFSTVHYGRSSELLEGLHEGLDRSDVILVGSTGDGYYHHRQCGDVGCVAMGLDSGGKVDWQVTSIGGVHIDPEASLQQAWSQIRWLNDNQDPQLMFLFSDFRTDASEMEKVLRHQIKIPVIGGFAADDNQMSDCAFYVGDTCLKDSLVLLSARGDLKFAIHVGNSISAVGKPGVIEKSDGANILSIDGLSAMDFIERETGKPVLQSDRGVTSLSILSKDDDAVKRLRAIVPDFSISERSVGLYGGIEQGERVQVCLAEPEQLLQEVGSIADHCRQQDFDPQAALIVSCAGRKWLLGDKVEKEVTEIVSGDWVDLPLAGFPSFGEIAPLPIDDGYSDNLFHNMTYVLLLLGE